MTKIYDLLSKKGTAVAFTVGAVISVLFYGIAFASLPDGFNTMDKAEQYANGGGFNFGLYSSLFLIVIATIVMLIGLVMYFVNNRSAWYLLAAFLGIVALFFILSWTSGSETSGPVAAALEKFNVSVKASKYVSGGIKTAMILLILSFVLLIGAELRAAFR